MKVLIKKIATTVVTTAAAAAIIMTATPPAMAQNATGIQGAFGSVNIQRIMTDSKNRMSDRDELQKYHQSLVQRLQRLDEMPAAMLPEQDIRELVSLTEKATPTDPEKQRIQVLSTKARDLSNELSELQNRKDPTDAQRQRLAELTTALQRGKAALNQVEQDYGRQLDTRKNELTKKITDDVTAAIAKVAQEKKLAVVFDSMVALYSANDITNDVIKILNK